MTDLERFKELYASVGIPLQEQLSYKSDRWELLLEAKTHDKLMGYSGFYTQIDFTLNGQFIEQSVWE